MEMDPSQSAQAKSATSRLVQIRGDAKSCNNDAQCSGETTPDRQGERQTKQFRRIAHANFRGTHSYRAILR